MSALYATERCGLVQYGVAAYGIASGGEVAAIEIHSRSSSQVSSGEATTTYSSFGRTVDQTSSRTSLCDESEERPDFPEENAWAALSAEERQIGLSEDEPPYGDGAGKKRGRLPAVGATLRPGRKGTKRLVARFGQQLLCVRYRYDRRRKIRMTTVELSISETAWNPPPLDQVSRRRPAALVEVRLAFSEIELARRIRAARGFFDKVAGVWVLRRDQAFKLGLGSRMRPARSQSASTPTHGRVSSPTDPID